MIESPGKIRKWGLLKIILWIRYSIVWQLKALQTIFKNASLESYLVDTIEETMWEKFIFISALASATSYLNQNIGK
jgi:2-dehydropantoate 2-reductase